jgi:phosphohistidine phosphatase
MADRIELIFFRHGLADWEDWHGPDDERPINPAGKSETHQVAAYLAEIGVKPAKILTSSLPRASQTAEIAAEHLSAPIEVAKSLAKNFDAAKLVKLIMNETGPIMLVGHEPNFSEVIEELTGGKIKLRKSGVARLTIDRKKMRGRLDWLLTPATCRPR